MMVNTTAVTKSVYQSQTNPAEKKQGDFAQVKQRKGVLSTATLGPGEFYLKGEM